MILKSIRKWLTKRRWWAKNVVSKAEKLLQVANSIVITDILLISMGFPNKTGFLFTM